MKTKAELIESKILGELTSLEEKEFRRLLSVDEDFAKEYQLHLQLSDYLMKKELIHFRNNLKEVSKDYHQSREITKTVVLRKYWKHIAAAAAILVLFGSSFLIYNQSSSSDQLFEDYYQTDEVFLNTRSGSATPSDLLEQGLMLFESDKYQESINYFEKLPTSITAIYYSGVAHMELGEYDVAEYKFDQVIKNYVNVFYDQALWYKGLCLMKQGQVDDAKSIFNTISKSDSFYKSKAKELKKKL